RPQVEEALIDRDCTGKILPLSGAAARAPKPLGLLGLAGERRGGGCVSRGGRAVMRLGRFLVLAGAVGVLALLRLGMLSISPCFFDLSQECLAWPRRGKLRVEPPDLVRRLEFS